MNCFVFAIMVITIIVFVIDVVFKTSYVLLEVSWVCCLGSRRRYQVVVMMILCFVEDHFCVINSWHCVHECMRGEAPY